MPTDLSYFALPSCRIHIIFHNSLSRLSHHEESNRSSGACVDYGSNSCQNKGRARTCPILRFKFSSRNERERCFSLFFGHRRMSASLSTPSSCGWEDRTRYLARKKLIIVRVVIVVDGHPMKQDVQFWKHISIFPASVFNAEKDPTCNCLLRKSCGKFSNTSTFSPLLQNDCT